MGRLALLMILTLPHKPQGAQWDFYRLDTRHTVSVIGRQWGKSTIAMLRAVKKVMSRADANHLWTEPVTSQAKVQFKRFIKDYKHFYTGINLTDMEATLHGGGRIKFTGSDNYVNLKSDTLTSATIDECGTSHPELWHEVIRPMLAVNRGGCDFIGTPKGKNWFFDLWQQSGDDAEYSRLRFPSNTSPFFSQAEFDRIKANTPEAMFRQEYLAEFLDEGSEVFRFFKDCVSGTLAPPLAEGNYIMGVDLAKHNDWTVITVWDIDRSHLVYIDRFNQIEWPMQEHRIIAAAETYNNAIVYLDATGVGDPVFDRLRHRAHVVPIKLTAPVKAHLIEKLAFALEKREITFPEIPELIAELQSYSIEKTPAGNVRYSAPSGLHDDIVMSMALAVAHLGNRRVIENVRIG